MKWHSVAMAAGLAASLAIVLQAEQGGRAGGAAPTETGGSLIGGTLTPAKPDARGWGWQVNALINPATPRPFYNKAKELLFQDKQITSYTIATYIAEFYCEVAKHYDYIWFEMQHSTMSYATICRASRVVAERSPLSGRAGEGARCGAQVRKILRQRRCAVSEWLSSQRGYAHGPERTRR